MPNKESIEEIVNSSFSNAFSTWKSEIGKELYPAAFANDYSYLRVKNALTKNNEFLQKAITDSLINVLEQINQSK